MNAKFAQTNTLIKRMVTAMSLCGDSDTGTQAGYTYLGQLIAHDIVPATNPSLSSRTVTPILNLDSLYGTAPYDRHLFNDQGEFIIANDGAKGPQDLMRDIRGQAMIPELRNDENTIVSQLHLMFLNYHNSLMSDLRNQKGPTYVEENFEAVKSHVIRYFQHIVVSEFLEKILNAEVYNAYFVNLIPLPSMFLPGRIPSEFSHAAFRFGHSMVRTKYQGFGRCLDEIRSPLHMSKLFRRHVQLNPRMKIDWSSFFSKDTQLPNTAENRMSRNFAQGIDLAFSDAMRSIPTRHGPIINIIEKNLIASNQIGLPGARRYLQFFNQTVRGREFRDRFEFQELSSDNLQRENDHLHDNNFRPLDPEELYLWPYILLESRTYGSKEKLGVLGSLIVAEVISNAIKLATPTIWSQNQNRFTREKIGGPLSDELSQTNKNFEPPEGQIKPDPGYFGGESQIKLLIDYTK